jgi:hypothetical protein
LGTIALTTSTVPGFAKAKNAAKVVEVTKDAAETIDLYKTVGTFVAGGVATLVGVNILTAEKGSTDCIDKIDKVFPGAIANKKLVSKVQKVLEKYDYGKSSLLATSFCADELNRVLEDDFASVYGENFAMGGLSGFPFGGVTAFGAMAIHIPDGGSCLIVFGPHVGVDSKGNVGTVERRGRADGGPCCGAAMAAAQYVASVSAGTAEAAGPPSTPTDAQQSFVGSMLLPYASRLDKASDKQVELPYVLYDAQKKMMSDIVKAKCGAVPGDGKIAILGGIQINTPKGTSDYFKPMSFEIYDNTGKLIEDLTNQL